MMSQPPNYFFCGNRNCVFEESKYANADIIYPECLIGVKIAANAQNNQYQ